MDAMAIEAERPRQNRPTAAAARHEALDLARALAMLGMLVVHTLGTHRSIAEGVLWTSYGWTAPLFVTLAGAGLSLSPATVASRPVRPRGRAMVVARAALLLLIGLTIAPLGEGNILHYYGVYFLVGVCVIGVSRAVLTALAALCLVAGPLLITFLFHVGVIDLSTSQADVGLGAFGHPIALLRALTLDGAYPAIVWLGFFFTGMILGRLDLTSGALARCLLRGGAIGATIVFIAGWAGARRFGSEPLGWTHHWTTYGLTESLAWTLASAAVVLAIVGGALRTTSWVGTNRPRCRALLAPLIALGQMPLTFYLLHLAYAGTVWERLDPSMTTTFTYLLATLGFWLAFAFLAQQWMRRVRRGPLESVVHGVASMVVRPPSHTPVARAFRSPGGADELALDPAGQRPADLLDGPR